MSRAELEELLKKIKKLNIPFAYRFFKEKTKLPYLCYLFAGTNNFIADGSVYLKIDRIRLELYTREKDILLEEKLEEELSSYAWQKEENYITDENCYQIIYEIEV